MAKEGGTPIPIIGWLDEPVKQSIKSVFDGVNRGVEARDLLRKYQRNHFERLNAELKYIKILGMEQPVELVNLYSPAMISSTVPGRLYEQDWLDISNPGKKQISNRRRSRQTIQADIFIEKHDHAVILGPAGSGKTTLLRYLALTYCNKELFHGSNLQVQRLPFYVTLYTYCQHAENGISIKEYFATRLQQYTDKYASDFVERAFRNGLAAIFLDSLDEVPLQQREKTLQEIRELAIGYPKNKIVVSSRTADYNPIHECFNECELSRLSDNAINKIINAWFSSEPEKAVKLQEHLRNDDGFHSLCETPLLLSLLCIQFKHDLLLPKRKIQLYRRCIEAFLRDWDASRGFRRDSAYSQLSDDRKERIFETVAGAFFKDGLRYVFPEEQLLSHIEACCDRYEISTSEAKNVLKEIEAHHGILERYSADSFMFSHLSFQEYFCARQILASREETLILKEHYKDERWASVIEFTVGLHPDPKDVLSRLMQFSDMEGIRNFPPLATRMKTLTLLYHSLIAGAAITQDFRNQLYDHIIDSHFHMAETFMMAGVLPMATLSAGTVRHTYVYNHKRPSLPQALQPLGVLANEIFNTAPDDYTSRVIERLNAIDLNGDDQEEAFKMASISLCLAVPIAYSRPQAVARLLNIAEQRKSDHMGRTLKRLLQVTHSELTKTGRL
jgi:energy-coupling factor transporter ATP-binding protein EcfA2